MPTHLQSHGGKCLVVKPKYSWHVYFLDKEQRINNGQLESCTLEICSTEKVLDGHQV